MTVEPPPIENWGPLSLEQATEVFADAPFRWWVGGGIALELYAGFSWRSHDDLDIGVLRAQIDDVYTWLSPDWDLRVAARGRLTPWQGEPLDPEQGENNVWAREAPGSQWRFDITVDSANDTEWIYRRDESTRRLWDSAVLWSSDGHPYLAPEIQLLFKSKNPRPKDDLDAEKVIPLLDADQRIFLADHLESGHHWRHLVNPG